MRPTRGCQAALAAKEVRSVLITGANAGVGKEVARQLARRPEVEKVYLGVRNPAKGAAARAELEAATSRRVFEVVEVDVADLVSARKAAENLPAPVDGLLMNAGGAGGKTPIALTSCGATEIVASNVLGHAVLLETLLAQRKLTTVAIWTGSEAARGVPAMGIPRPAFPTTSAAELESVIDGSWYRGHKFKPMIAYAHAKYLAALWLAAEARRHPKVRMLTVSPGGTRGTDAARDMNPVQRFVYNKIIMGVVMPLRGQAHTVDVDAARDVDALFDDRYGNGVFYASKENRLTGALVDQAEIFPDLGDRAFQDNAYAAVHRFID